MVRHPETPVFTTAPPPRIAILRCMSLISGHFRGLKNYIAPRVPEIKANPFERGRYLYGRISEGIAWTMATVGKVNPIRIPPPMSMFILVAFAEIIAPANATSGGRQAIYFLSSTSDNRPTTGDRAA